MPLRPNPEESVAVVPLAMGDPGRLAMLCATLGVMVGVLCIAAGLALSVLPGPLTIPPVLLGLWLWSTEFGWAHRFFQPFKQKGEEAWDHAKRHPVSSTFLTILGLVLAGVALWATSHFNLVDRGRDMVGL